MVIEWEYSAPGGKFHFKVDEVCLLRSLPSSPSFATLGYMKIDKFLVLIIVSIILLSTFTYWQFKKLAESLPEIKMPEVEIPKPETFFQPEIEAKEFISPDGKLKFKYSSDWVEMPGEGWQEPIDEAKILLFLTKFKIEKAAFASLIVQELDWEKGLKEVMEKIENEAKEKGGEIKFLDLEIGDRKANFKARYKKEEANFISKEKIILGKEKVYLISIFSLERFWPEFEGEAEEILNSVEMFNF